MASVAAVLVPSSSILISVAAVTSPVALGLSGCSASPVIFDLDLSGRSHISGCPDLSLGSLLQLTIEFVPGNSLIGVGIKLLQHFEICIEPSFCEQLAYRSRHQ